MTKRRVYFYPAAGQSMAPDWQYGHHAMNPDSVTSLLAEYYCCSGQSAPSLGYRLDEFKHDNAAATFDHQGGVTHHRHSPWLVSQVEEYVANTGLEALGEVVICLCDYSPLPEEENPWVETAPPQVSLDSFDGDAAAYGAWQRSQAVMV